MKKYNDRPYWSVEYDLLRERERIMRGFENGEIKTFADAIMCGLNSTRLFTEDYTYLGSAWLSEDGSIVLDMKKVMKNGVAMTDEEVYNLPVEMDDPLFDHDDDGYTILTVKIKRGGITSED